MLKVNEKILEECGGDMTIYNNWVAFANFLCDMIELYGEEVLAEIEEEKKMEAKKKKGKKRRPSEKSE